MKTFSPSSVSTKRLVFTPSQRNPPIADRVSPPSTELSADRIRARAYEIYEARTANGGTVDPVADWVQAERELKATASVPQASEVEVKAQARGERLLASGE